MKCRKCGREAVVKLKHYNLPLCEEHFYEFFKERVRKAIKKFKMFTENEKILVAVSGGKDSMVLWKTLVELGYDADGLFIKLGHGDEVNPAYEKVKKLAERLEKPLIVEDATEYLFGLSVFEAAKILRRPTCSYCGMVKRYIMNKVAVERGYDVLVTGHNLSDEASVLLGNILHWQMGYVRRSWPLLEKTHEKFVKKAKPLVLHYEDDIKLYAEYRKIEHLESACPFSLGATSKVYKKLMNDLEEEQRGAILQFYMGFVKEKEKLFANTEEVVLNSCEVCGYPTTEKICTFCRSKDLLKKKLIKKGVLSD